MGIKEYSELCAKVFRKKIEENIRRSLSIIKQGISLAQSPYVSWSGGKDSTVMLHIVLQVAPQIPVLYRDCGATFPQAMDYILAVSYTHLTLPTN